MHTLLRCLLLCWVVVCGVPATDTCQNSEQATVHQLLPTLSPRDAVGNSTLELHQLLLDMGHDARLWAANIHHELTGTARPLGELPDAKAPLGASGECACHVRRQALGPNRLLPPQELPG